MTFVPPQASAMQNQMQPPQSGAPTPQLIQQQMGGMPANNPPLPDFLTNPTLPPEQVYQTNPMVQEVLWRRLDSMPPEMIAALDQAITPDNADAFKALFPELEPIIDQASSLAGMVGDPSTQGGILPMPSAPASGSGAAGQQPLPPVGGASSLPQMKFGG